jgi:DNA-binding response OmpR family regulator
MSLRVLLADGDPVLLSIYRAFLVDQRIEVRTARDASVCLEDMRCWRPDVLVIDADLPAGSALGVLGVMSEDVTVPVVPVLLLSSGAPIDDRDIPIRDYALMIKPVPATVLADIIRTLADSGWGDRPRLGVPPSLRGRSGRPALARTEQTKETYVAARQLMDMDPGCLARPGVCRLGAPGVGETTARGV